MYQDLLSWTSKLNLIYAHLLSFEHSRFENLLTMTPVLASLKILIKRTNIKISKTLVITRHMHPTLFCPEALPEGGYEFQNKTKKELNIENNENVSHR